MRQTLVGILVCAAIICAYLYLPLQWRRHKDIELGQTISKNIENYRKTKQKLPDEHDEAALKILGFHHDKEMGWQPNYRRINDQDYELVYRNGFVPPYLSWNSRDKQWILVDK